MPLHPYLFYHQWYKVDLVTAGWLVVTGIAVFIMALVMRSRLDMRSPKGLQNVMEWVFEFTGGMTKDNVGSNTGRRIVAPLAFVILVYLFFSNWLGLILTIEWIPGHNISSLGVAAGTKYSLLNSPTENLNMTMALAILVWFIGHLNGLRHPWHWFKHVFIHMFPMGIIDEVLNPLTHGMRLYGNILAGEVLIEAILRIPKLLGFLPTGLPLLVIWLLYSAFVSTIQAYIFTMLVTLYIGNKDHSDTAHHVA